MYPHITHQSRRMLQYLPGDAPLVGAEIGVHRGKTSATLLARRPLLTLYMVDYWGLLEGIPPPEGRYGEDIYREAMDETRFAVDRRVIVPLLSPEAASEVPDGLDFVFVDAGHTYGECRDDLRAWWPKINPDGYLFGHDIDNPNPEHAHWGVRRAVEEFSQDAGVPFEVHPYPEMVFVFRRP